MQNGFDEVFEVELKCWCFGLERVNDPIEGGVVHKVIKEFAPVMRQAIVNLYSFDVVDTGRRIAQAAKNQVCEKEITFSLLSNCPYPDQLNDAQTAVLIDIVRKAETAYPGAIQRMEKKWTGSRTDLRSLHAQATDALGGLNLPGKSASQR